MIELRLGSEHLLSLGEILYHFHLKVGRGAYSSLCALDSQGV